MSVKCKFFLCSYIVWNDSVAMFLLLWQIKKTKYTEVHFVILILVLVKITSFRSKPSRTQQPWGKPSRKSQPSRK